ncbi:MAG: non-canonical purine NTP pyrophosphatase, partial [Erysipelotrichaceae bacterium]
VLDMIKDNPNRNAKYVCAIAYVNDCCEKTFVGEFFGTMGYSQEGTNGFGYDPIFRTMDNRSLATLSMDEKNAISHRHMALEKFIKYLKGEDDE